MSLLKERPTKICEPRRPAGFVCTAKKPSQSRPNGTRKIQKRRRDAGGTNGKGKDPASRNLSGPVKLAGKSACATETVAAGARRGWRYIGET